MIFPEINLTIREANPQSNRQVGRWVGEWAQYKVFASAHPHSLPNRVKTESMAISIEGTTFQFSLSRLALTDAWNISCDSIIWIRNCIRSTHTQYENDFSVILNGSVVKHSDRNVLCRRSEVKLAKPVAMFETRINTISRYAI